jgi:predicted unusual protein kinase regulating ubiquinone biosynthesis (AarF/ABC1/UbiB family)
VKFKEEEIDYVNIHNLLVEEPGLQFTSLKPFHSGTVSVTFQARLHRKPVIIKVLRKDIHEKLHQSVRFLLFITNLLSYLPFTCDLQLYDIMTENIDSLLIQSDLTIEGKYTKKFHNCLLDHEHLYSPSVHFVSKEILIQEYVYGKNIFEIGNLEEETRRVICASIYEFIFQSMCDLGTFHGDMHPGNLLFVIESPCCSSTDDFTITFIDYGITYQVEEENRMKIMKIIWMLTEVDDTQFFNYLYDNGIKETSNYQSSLVCKEKIVKELVELRKTYDIFRNTIKPMDVYYANKVLKKYNLRIHPEYSRAFMFLYSMTSLMSMLQCVDTTLYQKCLKVYFAMNHEKLKHLA